MKKNIKLIIVAFVLGAVIFGSIGSVVAYNIAANQIEYTPQSAGWKVNSVSEAIDSLYISKAGENYSTSEKVVGTWIDGKPIYQRSFVVTSAVTLNGGGSSSVQLPGFSDDYVSDILPTLDAFLDIEVKNSLIDSDTKYDFPKNIRIVKSNGYIHTYDNPGVAYVGYKIGEGAVVTIKYTKTTDTAPSQSQTN